MVRTLFASLAAVLVGSAGCAVEPAVVPITGPDGSRMLHVSCAAAEGRCFQLAGENCPLGYDIFAVHPPSGESYLVRCHYTAAQNAPAGGWQASYRPPYPATTATTTSAPPPRAAPAREGSQWPPTGEPDTVSPWPAAGAKPATVTPSVGSATTTPMSGLPGSPDDIGY